MCRRKHTGRRDIGASQREGDRSALRAAAPTQRGLSSLQPSARTSRREGVPISLFALCCPYRTGTPSLCEVRAEGWSELSPRCVGAAARRAGLSPSFCDAPISRRPVCFLRHTLTPLGSAELGGFSRVPMVSGPESSGCHQLRERSYGPGGSGW